MQVNKSLFIQEISQTNATKKTENNTIMNAS